MRAGRKRNSPSPWLDSAAVIGPLQQRLALLRPAKGIARLAMLAYLRGVAPPNVTTADIYRGVVPFILMQIVALLLVFLYPGLATWLPKAIGW